MLIQRKGKEDTYEFYFKHIQEYLEDRIDEEETEKECHEQAVKYYETKEEIFRDKFTIDDEVEMLYHRVKSNPTEQLVNELLDIGERLYPIHYGFKRLIYVGEVLKNSVNERNKAPIDVILGVLYWNLQRFEEAETMYLDALKVYKKLAEQSPDAYLPDVAMTQNNLGVLYNNVKRFEEAENCFNEVLKKEPNNSSAWYNKACLESLRNNKAKSLEYLAKAIDLDQKYIEIAKYDDDFNNIRDSKEFEALIRGLG